MGKRGGGKTGRCGADKNRAGENEGDGKAEKGRGKDERGPRQENAGWGRVGQDGHLADWGEGWRQDWGRADRGNEAAARLGGRKRREKRVCSLLARHRPELTIINRVGQ